MDTHYKNIAIAGGVAVGSTSLMKALQPVLEPEGFIFRSTGTILREHMIRQGLDNKHNPHAQNLSADDNQNVEDEVLNLLASGKKYVIDGWLSGFVSRNIEHTLRVLLVLPDIEIRIERFIAREPVSKEEARAYILEREQKNISFWKGIYGDFDFWDPSYYHLVIDTTHTSKEAARDIVLEEFGCEPNKV